MTRQQRWNNALGEEWGEFLQSEMNADYMRTLSNFVAQEYTRAVVCPRKHEIFRAFKETSLHNTKCVILGQDPYSHFTNEGMVANGIAFSTFQTKTPDSLKNLFSEIADSLGFEPIFDSKTHNNLLYLCSQGVLLLNAYLSTRKDLPLSHGLESPFQGLELARWDMFTGKVLELLSLRRNHMVFVLMGEEARSMKFWIQNPNDHLIIETTHPTSKSFDKGDKALKGSNFANKVNQYLIDHDILPIKWIL